MAQLAHPPGLPTPLEGILNLAGAAAVVLRLDRLLGLPERNPGLYSMLIILKGVCVGGTALVVDRVSEILSVPESLFLPVGEGDSFNGCTEAAVHVSGQVIHLLSPTRILLEKERASLGEFQAMAQQRLHTWEQEKQ